MESEEIVKKLLFLVGVAAGFVLGSWAGRAPYEQLEAKARQVSGKPAVRETMDQVIGAVKEQAEAVKEKVADRLPHNGDGTAEHASAGTKASKAS
jgi:hypothetical protein